MKYFDEIKKRPDGKTVYVKKYTSMVIEGIYDKKDDSAKVCPIITPLMVGLCLLGLLFGIVGAFVVYGYYLLKAPGRVKEFRERLEKEVG